MNEANMNKRKIENTMSYIESNGNGELVKELHKLLVRINDYVQHPDPNHFADLVSEDLMRHYGRKQVEETARVVVYGNGCYLPVLSQRFTELFRVFNERYFSGELPPCKVRVRQWVNHFETGSISQEEQCLEILVASEGTMVKRLLAEMARMASSGDYGDRWEAEMTRLGRAGAPIHLYNNTIDYGHVHEITAGEFIQAASRPPIPWVPELEGEGGGKPAVQ
jgi:hypothetical protein